MQWYDLLDLNVSEIHARNIEVWQNEGKKSLFSTSSRDFPDVNLR